MSSLAPDKTLENDATPVSNPDGWLYSGTVYHRRRRPREHVLRYRVFSLLLDIDRIDELVERIPWISRNRFNLVSFHDKDFGVDRLESGSADLRAWIEASLQQAGLPAAPHRILLSCYPRVLGYAFNPLSLYYCCDASGRTYAVVHEVHNTFGERHAYVLAVGEGASASKADPDWIKQSTDKELFVSPFAHMKLRYRFRLNEPSERQVIVIHAEDSDGVLITASYTAKRQELTSRGLLRRVASMPLMTFKVTAGIHYEALKLWLKRVPLFAHEPRQHATSHHPHGTETNPPT